MDDIEQVAAKVIGSMVVVLCLFMLCCLAWEIYLHLWGKK